MNFNVHGSFETSSFGRLSELFIQALLEDGNQVRAVPHDVGYGDFVKSQSDLSDTVRHHLGTPLSDAKNLAIYPIGWPFFKNAAKADFVFTLWETDKLPSCAVKVLNGRPKVATANAWNHKVFRTSGIKKAISIIPLGIDKAYVPSVDLPYGRTFITMGRLGSGPQRKGITRAISAFLLAADECPEIQLLVKTTKHTQIEFTHQRIKYIAADCPLENMVKLYQSGFCYLSGVTSEGWGWHQHEAMACGLPLIAVKWGGLQTFWPGNKAGWEVKYDIVPAHDKFHQVGNWTDPSVSDMARHMVEAAKAPRNTYEKGKEALKAVEPFTLENMFKAIIKFVS